MKLNMQRELSVIKAIDYDLNPIKKCSLSAYYFISMNQNVPQEKIYAFHDYFLLKFETL